MLNQQTLRKKIAATHNIKHIAEAIELVASVKLQKLLQKTEHFRFYAKKLIEIIENLTETVGEQAHPFFDVREVKSIGVVVITGDKGLCGSYNMNVLKQADHFLEHYSREGVKLILFGQKSVSHYSKSDYHIQNQYVNYVPKINEANARGWSIEIAKSFENRELDEVWVVYTHYKNILVRETKVEKILPMQKKAVKEDSITKEKKGQTKNLKSDYIFEPGAEEIYQKVIPAALYTKFQSLLLESQTSELSARVVSMKAAATNAEEMITKLTLIKNKIRQFGITKEILEINAGAEGIA